MLEILARSSQRGELFWILFWELKVKKNALQWTHNVVFFLWEDPQTPLSKSSQFLKSQDCRVWHYLTSHLQRMVSACLRFIHDETCLSPGAEPDPGTEGREEPHPAGSDAPGGSGAQPIRRPGTRGHTRQRLHTNLSLQASLFLLLVVRDGWGRRTEERRLQQICFFLSGGREARKCEYFLGEKTNVEKRHNDRKWERRICTPENSSFCEENRGAWELGEIYIPVSPRDLGAVCGYHGDLIG